MNRDLASRLALAVPWILAQAADLTSFRWEAETNPIAFALGPLVPVAKFSLIVFVPLAAYLQPTRRWRLGIMAFGILAGVVGWLSNSRNLLPWQ